MKHYLTKILCWCIVVLWGRGTISPASSYFEYKYYCDIQTNLNITISLQATSPQSKKCLYYADVLTQNITYYKQQINQFQTKPTDPDYAVYQESYLGTITPKLLQSTVLHTYLIKAMNEFEQELFTKTMIYVRYRYKSTRINLQQSIDQRTITMSQAIKSGDADALQKISTKYNSYQRQLTILNVILEAKNFEQLMPFYTMYKAWKFE